MQRLILSSVLLVLTWLQLQLRHVYVGRNTSLGSSPAAGRGIITYAEWRTRGREGGGKTADRPTDASDNLVSKNHCKLCPHSQSVSQSVSQSHPDRRADRTNERTKRQANSDSAKDATGNDDGTPLELAEKWRERASELAPSGRRRTSHNDLVLAAVQRGKSLLGNTT